MANVFSTAVSNITTIPQTISNRGLNQGDPDVYKQGIVTTAANIANTNVIYVCPLNWTDKIHSLVIHNTDLDSGGAALVVDVGVYKYQPKDGTYTVVDQDAYAVSSAIFAGANLGGTNLAFTARIPGNVDQTVFQDCGLTSIPTDGSLPLLALTVTTAATTAAAGSIAVVVQAT